LESENLPESNQFTSKKSNYFRLNVLVCTIFAKIHDPIEGNQRVGPSSAGRDVCRICPVGEDKGQVAESIIDQA
jgi:hypothetical protein